MLETLNVDANYLFQDVVKIKAQQNDVTISEYDMVKRYRFIEQFSPKGKETIDYILNREYGIAEMIKDMPSAIEQENTSPVRLINYYYRLASAGTGQEV